MIRVLIKESAALRIRADGDIPLIVKGLSSSRKKLSTLNVKAKEGRLFAVLDDDYRRPSYLSASTELRISSRDKRGIWLGKRRYRGQIRIFLINNKLNAINHIGVEDYLISVVGSEMPKSWPLQALKAQAVAARTYVLKNIGKNKYFDVSSSESSQVYLGVESETLSTRKAVNLTKSLVLAYKGELINAVFHSSSGGNTEASGSVWKKQLPYLVSVTDYDQASPYYKWERRFSPKKLDKVFDEVNGLENIKVIKTSNTGRVIKAKIKGPGGSIVISGKDLRYRLGLKSTLINVEMLPVPLEKANKGKRSFPLFASTSKNQKLSNELPTSSELLRKWQWYEVGWPFTKSIELSNLSPPLPLPKAPELPIWSTLTPPPKLPIPSKKPILIVKGAGAGHGVGMSQWGAYGLARKGASYRKILTHFYKGANVVKF